MVVRIQDFLRRAVGALSCVKRATADQYLPERFLTEHQLDQAYPASSCDPCAELSRRGPFKAR